MLIDINRFKFEEQYDREMIEEYRKNISFKNSVYDKLYEIEGVAYLGFTMGLRDGSRSQARYWDNNCEDF